METKDNESGRSMVEMLGVLAIMGVLAIGGIAGYRWAMDKYNANEILNEVRKRAVTASQQRILGHAINLSEYGNNTIQGHSITTADNYDGDTSFFALTVSGIEKDICDKVIKEKIPFAIDTWVGDDADECAEGNNDITFAFANTLDGEAALPKEDKPICETDSDCASVEGKPVCVDGTCQIGYYCQESSLYRSDIGLIQTCESGCSRQTPIYYSSDKEAFVNLCYVPQCKWTGWLSRPPSFDKTGGDFESLEGICDLGWAADISCRAAMYHTVPISELGQVVLCNTSVGLVCRNQDQKPGAIPMPYCLDYEINVYCCDVSDMPEAPVEEKRVCNTKGQCFFCSVAAPIPVKSQADCAVCDGTNGTTKRYYWKGYCYTTCPDNTTANEATQECVLNEDTYCYGSSCYSCSDSNLNQYIGTSSEAQSYCASCDGTDGKTRRFYGNGSCYSCSFSGSVYVGTTDEGKAMCHSCNTGSDKRYYNESNGHRWCGKCPTSLSYLNTQEECTQCGGTWSDRKCS